MHELNEHGASIGIKSIPDINVGKYLSSINIYGDSDGFDGASNLYRCK